ncbi:nuclear transport factor 2 family protein [Luteimonas sp. R10]|uniref:nuclear transport factor 2 family protein n=1 Tax=Luteimonas sp. R10 TaxID=3108176 RepID=UPI00308A3389|nr:nuclear transport factor 2 family protein [Luteimonas sp. R10]
MNEAAERDAIESLMQDYFDGLYLSDTKRLRRAFDPQAHYFTASGGSLLHYDMEQYFPVIDARPSPASKGEPRSDRILSIEFAGPVTALVKAECSVPPRSFMDLLTLVKVDDRWRIVAKVFHYDIRD